MNASRGRLLARDAAIDYWDERHGSQTELRAGGDIGIDEAANQAFYKQRLGVLLAALGGPGSVLAPPQLLDVGCGNGWFARELDSCGYAVTGIDSSATAIRQARDSGGGPTYVESSLDEMWLTDLFDFVVSVDVLFHLTDDDVFHEALRRMDAHLASEGLLVVAERNEVASVELGDYIVHRPQEVYARTLGTSYRYLGFRPYDFPGNPIGFHSYRKVMA